MSGIWKALLPFGLNIVEWLIRKRLLKESAKKSFLEFIHDRIENQRSSKDLSDQYWEQVERLKARRMTAEANFARVLGRLAIVVGHTKKSPGAKGVEPIGDYEYFYNKSLAQRISEIAVSRKHDVEVLYRDTGGIIAAYKTASQMKPDCVIELHFNAFNGKVRGTEVLHSDKNDHVGVNEVVLARALHDRISNALGRQGKTRRGVKNLAKGDRGHVNVSQLLDVPCCLIEPFFGDNPEDATLAVRMKDEIALAVVEAFEEYIVHI